MAHHDQMLSGSSYCDTGEYAVGAPAHFQDSVCMYTCICMFMYYINVHTNCHSTNMHAFDD